MSESKLPAYPEDQIKSKLSTSGLSEWKLEDGWLRRKYSTDGWPITLMLVNAIGFICEAADHHADLAVSWGKVWVVSFRKRIRQAASRTKISSWHARSRTKCSGSLKVGRFRAPQENSCRAADYFRSLSQLHILSRLQCALLRKDGHAYPLALLPRRLAASWFNMPGGRWHGNDSALAQRRPGSGWRRADR